MNRSVILFVVLMLSSASKCRGTLLYDNTTFDTGDTVLYSIGPYVALGDQIHLASAGNATQAAVQMFNNGGAGTFDAELDLFDVDSPVGSLIGAFHLTDNVSLGGDVINLTFDLGTGVAVPQDIIFTVTLSNMTAGVDLGLDMFEPPTVGSSDNSFMIAATSVLNYLQLPTNSENVYFQLSSTPSGPPVPEPSSLILLTAGLVAFGVRAKSIPNQSRHTSPRTYTD